jgi:hypothetical protein
MVKALQRVRAPSPSIIKVTKEPLLKVSNYHLQKLLGSRKRSIVSECMWCERNEDLSGYCNRRNDGSLWATQTRSAAVLKRSNVRREQH